MWCLPQEEDVEVCEQSSHRLALQNMDWDKISAQDLMILFNSFKPPTGVVKR